MVDDLIFDITFDMGADEVHIEPAGEVATLCGKVIEPSVPRGELGTDSRIFRYMVSNDMSVICPECTRRWQDYVVAGGKRGAHNK